MSTTTRFTLFLLALLVGIPAGYRLFVYARAVNRIDHESGRQADLDEALEWSRWKQDGKLAALREYVEGRTTLEATAKRFREYNESDKWEMARLHRTWPSAATDEERHAADVLACLARRISEEQGHEVAYHRAADDYRRTYGEPPTPVKS